MYRSAVHADIRVGPHGVEEVNVEVPKGQRGEAYAWLERALPALQNLDHVTSAGGIRDRILRSLKEDIDV